MALNGDALLGIIAQVFTGLGQRGACIRADVGLIEIEVSIADFASKDFVLRGFGRWSCCCSDRDSGAGVRGTAGAAGRDRVGDRSRWRDFRRALRGYRTDVGSDGELRGVGGG